MAAESVANRRFDRFWAQEEAWIRKGIEARRTRNEGRVTRLEREGFIQGYRALLGRKKIGLGLTVFVGVKIEGHADDRATTCEEAVVAFPEVIACHMIAGEADYLLEVTVPDLDAYQKFLVGKLLNLPLVREVRSNIAIQTLKAAAALPLGHLG